MTDVSKLEAKANELVLAANELLDAAREMRKEPPKTDPLDPRWTYSVFMVKTPNSNGRWMRMIMTRDIPLVGPEVVVVHAEDGSRTMRFPSWKAFLAWLYDKSAIVEYSNLSRLSHAGSTRSLAPVEGFYDA